MKNLIFTICLFFAVSTIVEAQEESFIQKNIQRAKEQLGDKLLTTAEEELKQQILDIHQELINAHFEKNLDFFSQGISKNYVSVSNGEIKEPTLEEITDNYRDYITNTTFSEYRDLQEPIVGSSEDGTIAWAIVKVKVKGNRRLENGANREVDFICAWLTLYEKTNSGWDVLAEVSTFK